MLILNTPLEKNKKYTLSSPSSLFFLFFAATTNICTNFCLLLIIYHFRRYIVIVMDIFKRHMNPIRYWSVCARDAKKAKKMKCEKAGGQLISSSGHWPGPQLVHFLSIADVPISAWTMSSDNVWYR